MDLSLVVGGWVGCALIGVLAAERRGFSYLAGILGGLVLGPLAFLMLFATSSRRRCPACAEWVHNAATVCKHCKQAMTPPAAPSTPPTRWTVNTWLNVAIGLVVLAIGAVVAGRLLLTQ